jgi:hypothetical protein
MAFVYVEGTTQFAKVFEGQQDLGTNYAEGSEERNNLEAVQGKYVMNIFMDKETKAKAIADGIPNKGMVKQLWKEDDEGNIYYKCTRKHFNPKFTDRDTGEQGVVMGPPKIVMQTEDGGIRAWDKDTDGAIGNGSTVVVKFNVWQDKICEMEAVKVVEHVKYEPETNEGDF